MSVKIERNKELIRTHFPNLNDVKLINAIANVAEEHTFPAGKVIMDFGVYVNMIPLVLSGTIKVMREDKDGNELFLYYLNGGETCAASFTCCMQAKQSYMKTIAEEDTHILGLPIKEVDDWISEFRVWKRFVMQAYDARILDLARTVDSIAFLKMDERLLQYLKAKSTAINSKSISVTHQQIANDLNASREAISRLLKQLEKKGVIRLGRNKLEII